MTERIRGSPRYHPQMQGRRTSRANWREQAPIARQLRRRSTATETVLWAALRSKQLDGFKFRRQHPIGQFIADFYCVRAGLAIEIDGPVHSSHVEADRLRQEFLESRDIAILRFTNDDIDRDLRRVVATIAETLANRTA